MSKEERIEAFNEKQIYVQIRDHRICDPSRYVIKIIEDYFELKEVEILIKELTEAKEIMQAE